MRSHWTMLGICAVVLGALTGTLAAQAAPALPLLGAARPPASAPAPVTARALEAALYRAPVFAEPLVPMGPTTLKEDQALLRAVRVYARTARPTDLTPLQTFAQTYPHSAWMVALDANAGFADYRAGYFDRALQAWTQAWTRGQSAQDPAAHALVDRDVAALIKMQARLGHQRALAALLTAVRNRPLLGRAAATLQGAREGLWVMRHDPGVAYLCGPMALKNVLATLHPQDHTGLAQIKAYRSGPYGVTLNQVQALARRVHLAYTMAYRLSPATPIPLPAVIHWKVHHYAALVAFAQGRYQVDDPTFGRSLWMTPRAVAAETDGYFLIPSADATRAHG